MVGEEHAGTVMGKRAAVVTQADIARTIRAAKQAGAAAVEVRPDGTVLVHLTADTIPRGTSEPAPRPYRDIPL
ncbi:hypothetical protein [Aureimonas phyllosphaerae]|uniref:Uncharacterized protein n=1 Tax=Aureimonas phyllosphaerae TaxID=1166078 RepID=A0A7W6BTQ6_9HYPH|nr:hypothetical protein [Aureimonas phyllosphaerae]MBB3934888.1 hypothetical protein [Aureimonas phyllosphaerae]MBB3958896.1 hypothetical protein [Aureimonas phyllosphaerae]